MQHGGVEEADGPVMNDVDTSSWDPDFDDPGFEDSAGFGDTVDLLNPNIVTPTATECAFDPWAFSENEMDAMNEYYMAHSDNNNDPPQPPLPEDAPTPSISNLTKKSSTATTQHFLLTVDSSHIVHFAFLWNEVDDIHDSSKDGDTMAITSIGPKLIGEVPT